MNSKASCPALYPFLFTVGVIVLFVSLSINTTVAASPVASLARGQATLSVPTKTESAAPSACWSVVSSPNVGATGDVLNSLSAISANDVWAAGYSVSGGTAQTLVQRWNGSRWNIIPSINVPSENNYLTGIAALASNDVWVVGYHDTGPLVQHWDGAQWSIVSIPGNFVLNGISAVSANDIWAVGDAGRESVALHWDGQQWTRVPTNDPPAQYISVLAVKAAAAVSSNDVWAVGYEYDTVVQDYGGVFYHWDGLRWRFSYGTRGRLYGVAATATNDVWSVGHKGNTPFIYEPLQTLTSHWNGANWTEVPSPNVGTGDSYLRGVAAISPTDAWAVGGYGPRTGNKQTLILHWDGASWTVVPSPNIEPESNRLLAVEAVSASDIWAVGNYNGTNTGGTLTERYTGACIAPTPTHTPTSTPIPTSTPTPMYTPTPCTAGSFSDVPEGSTFYPFVQCLVRRAIISGYSDCTFRPNNEVTRGQLSKIVSNSAGFNEDPGEQRFEDVPPTNTFYEWIQRLAYRGYIGGYECGGPGEPCISGKPYFRPTANATRGQISKIVSNAAQFSDPPGEQIFEDVAPTHTFYEWIQRLASRNIMSGYPCGNPGEPCSSGKPYFRPQNNATRGQTSKIVANTFFPECQAP